MKTLPLFLLAFGLAGCAQPPDEASAAEPSVVRGRAFFDERIKMAPGADVTVQLLDEHARAIATTTLADVAGPPYAFALEYDATALRADGQYVLDATLRAVDGSVLFVTDPRVPVALPARGAVEVRMTRARGPGEPAPTPARIERTQWTCDALTFEATFDLDGERVDLALPEGALSLPLAQSASGARYADHRGNAFWTKGDAGTLKREGGGAMDCVRADPPVTPGSPWEKAQQRGIAFRAIGNEPGWLVEVGRGESPTLHAELDYGERKLDARVRALSGLLGFAGEADDGSPVRLVLERKACSDGMSDATYPVEVVLEAAGKTYRGCGRFLE